MIENNLAAMIIEYPVVPIGMARFRLQVMASHTEFQAHTAAQIIADVVEDVRGKDRSRQISVDK